MLDPLSPSHQSDKSSPEIPEKALQDPSEVHDNKGYRFNFFGKAPQKKQNKNESKQQKAYNESNAVELHLSPEAQERIKKQRNQYKG